MRRAILACGLVALCGCSGPRPAGSQPDTEIRIEDRSGAALDGEVQLWSPDGSGFCSVASSSCSVAMRPGVYDLMFERRVPGQPSGWPEVRTSGCLQARIRLEPGRRVVCRRTRAFDCSPAALENLDCGAASARAQPEGRTP